MQRELKERVKKRWETCCLAGAHLYPLEWLISEENMFKRYRRLVVEKIKIADKIIIDYGCGGGYLGKYLLKNYEIKKYIAFDIARRSIDRAKDQLGKYENVILKEVDNIPGFRIYNPDVLICLACIIHFPTKEYLDEFLEKVNESNAKDLILEIRDCNVGTKFRENVYETFLDGNKACITEEEYITKNLNNYEFVEKTNNNDHPSRCQILYYRRLEDE